MLSEEPVDDGNWTLEGVHEYITNGPASGEVEFSESVPVDGPTMAAMLEKQGSDPSFFNLDEHGNDDTED